MSEGIYMSMRHLHRIFEAQSADFRAVDFDDKTEIERHTEEISRADRKEIVSWFRGIGIEEDKETGWGGTYGGWRYLELPKKNYMVFDRTYELYDSVRLTAEVVRLEDDYWALRVQRFFWDLRMEDWMPENWPDRSYRCDDTDGLKAAFDATVRRLAEEYQRVEQVFDAARDELSRIGHLEKVLDRIPKLSRR